MCNPENIFIIFNNISVKGEKKNKEKNNYKNNSANY